MRTFTLQYILGVSHVRSAEGDNYLTSVCNCILIVQLVCPIWKSAKLMTVMSLCNITI